MFRGQNRIGVNITGTKLQFIEILSDNTEVRILNIGEQYFPGNIDWFFEKETVIEEILRVALRESVFSGKTNSKIVSFSFPLEVFRIFCSHYIRQLDKNELLRYYKWELSVLYPYLHISDYSISTAFLKSDSLLDDNRVIVAALYKRLMKVLLNLCREVGIIVGAVDTSHFAFDKTVQFLHKEFVRDISVTVYLDSNYFSFELFNEGNAVFYKMLPAKYDYYELLFDPEKIDPDLKSVMKRIKKIYLCNEGSSEIHTAFKEVNGAQIISSDLLSRLIVDDELKQKIGILNQQDYFSAAGMAFRVY
ncbi:MAG: hypothetical protein AB9882_03195 [Ignavibacteriaceae bacterium]